MRKRNSTLLKFVFSYLLIYLVLMMGFFYMIRYQFSEYYYEELRHQTEIQIDNLGNQLNEEFVYLSQISAMLQKNNVLMLYGYSKHDISNDQVMTELQKYDDASGIISSIVWKNNDDTLRGPSVVHKKSDYVFSTSMPVKFEENAYRIYYDTENYISVDASRLWGSGQNKMISVTQNDKNILVYVPDIGENRKNQFFLVLEEYYLLKTLNNLTSFNIPVISLLGADGEIVLTSNNKAAIPFQKEELASGFYEIDADNSCYIKTDIMGELSLAAMISRETLVKQINHTLIRSYWMFIAIGVIGFAFILWGMRVTYIPLYKLVKKVNSEEKVSQIEHFSYLEEHFSQMNKHNEQLRLQLDKYRYTIRKSLLDSVLQSSGAEVDFSDIDVLFANEQNCNLYVVSLASCGSMPVSVPGVLKYFKTAFGENVFYLVLESGKKELVFLVNDIGTQEEKSGMEKVKALLYDLHDKFQYVSAISESSRSILDIPMLYKEVKTMSERQGENIVQEWDDSKEAVLPVYPYEEIASLPEAMWDGDFDMARNLTKKILLNLDEASINNDVINSFYVQCVLLDVLTAIENVMNQQNISFDSYSDEYYTLLYLCRSCSYAEERNKIAENLDALLKVCERKLKRISYEEVKVFMDDSAYDPNFSIYAIADHFRLSVSQVSELVKKEMGVTFSEYLWSVRLQKAQELLLHSDISIEEISSQVGYLNVSSFRRRFKEELGVTPLKYRELYRK